MQTDFAKALPRILVYEGGKVDNPRDPGGRTNKGITQNTYNIFRKSVGLAQQDVYLITDNEVATIYKSRYWDMVKGDDLPAGLDLCVFDGGVNSGPGQSGKWLQRSLGDKFVGTIDGLIGPKTLQAVEDFGDIETLIGAYCARRLATLKSLSTWHEFGGGWSARIANGMKTGDAWAAGADAPHPVDVTAAGGHQKAPTSLIKPSPISQGAAHATTAASGMSAVATNAGSQLKPVADAFPHLHWLTAGLAALTAFGVAAGVSARIIKKARDDAEAGASVAAVNLDADVDHPIVPVDDSKPPQFQLVQKAP